MGRKVNNGKFWTEREIQQLITLKERGETHKFIAAEMGRTKESVTSRLQILRRERPELDIGKSHPAWSESEEAELKRMYFAGYTAREISERLGRSRPAVYSRIAFLKGGGSDV